MASRARLRQETSVPAPSLRGNRHNDVPAGAPTRPVQPEPRQSARQSRRPQRLQPGLSPEPPHEKSTEPKKKNTKPREKTKQIQKRNKAPQKQPRQTSSRKRNTSQKVTQRKGSTSRVEKRRPQPAVRGSHELTRRSLTIGYFTADRTLNEAAACISRIRHWVLNDQWPAADFNPINTMTRVQPPRVMSLQQETTMGQSGTKHSSDSNVGSRDKTFVKTLETGHPTIKCYQREYRGVEGNGPGAASKALCRELLGMTQSPLPDHRYDGEDLFLSTLERLDGKSERKVQHSLHDLICPQAEALADRITDPELRQKYDLLVDAMDEQWGQRAAIFKKDETTGQAALAMPKSDYCVGFNATKFSVDQRRKLFRAFGENSKWFPMTSVCFPFLTCEAKHMNGLDHADNQNAHSMALAITAVVELFRRAHCVRSIHREILGFSVSYNHKIVLLYGHYPVIKGEKTEIYRTTIGVRHFNSYHTHDRWASYKFVRSIYEKWAPTHFKRLCDAIDNIDGNFTVSDLSSNDFGTELANEMAQNLGMGNEVPPTEEDDDRTIQGNQPPLPPPPRPPTQPMTRSRYRLRSRQTSGARNAPAQSRRTEPSAVEATVNHDYPGSPPREKVNRGRKRKRKN